MNHLANLTATDWLVIAGASWTIAAFFVAPPIGRFLRGRADVTRRAQYPPPVPRPTTPPLTQTVASADWFRDIPVDCLSDDAVRPLFDDIVAGEFS